MTADTEWFTMSDGNKNLVHKWIPEGEVRGVVVISHGMAEHAARYEHFANLLAKNGIAVFAEDHRGHGETARLAQEKGTGDFGYLAPKDGFFRVVDDIHEEVQKVKSLYPQKKVVLLGHSFGSFTAQCFIETYASSIDACILSGTAGPRSALMQSAKSMAGCIKTFSDPKKPSKFLDHLAFGAYNKSYENPRTDFDWLSRDNEQVDKYIADAWCGFVCSTQFFYDMFTGLCYIHKKQNMQKIPKDLPVHIASGDADPVGDYGKSVKNLYDIYRANGMEKADLKLWPGARHEILNETNRDEVEADMLSFVNSVLA